MKAVPIIVALCAVALGAFIFLRPATEEPAVVQASESLVETVEAPAQPEPEAGDDDEAEAVVVEESSGEPEPAVDGERPLILAQADTSAVTEREWTFTEGEEFTKMVPTQPTVGGADKIEVAEFFWYGCNHCFDFEPYINRWAEDVPANVRFVRVPALWNPLVRLHGQLYYTEEVLAENGKLADREGFRNAVFLEYHRRRNSMASEGAIEAIFAEFGVCSEDFRSTWNSFEVNQKMRVAEDLARRYGIASVPMVVVNGKYKTSGADAGSYPRLLEVVDELVEREELLR